MIDRSRRSTFGPPPDDRSEVQFKLGSSGVPETFVIDGKGVITYQHIGDIRESDVPVLLADNENLRCIRERHPRLAREPARVVEDCRT